MFLHQYGSTEQSLGERTDTWWICKEFLLHNPVSANIRQTRAGRCFRRDHPTTASEGSVDLSCGMPVRSTNRSHICAFARTFAAPPMRAAATTLFTLSRSCLLSDLSASTAACKAAKSAIEGNPLSWAAATNGRDLTITSFGKLDVAAGLMSAWGRISSRRTAICSQRQ